MSVEIKKISKEKAFYFFTSIGNYTGENAASIEDFLEKIKQVDIKSIEFHCHRGDFEKWITEVVGDKGLAEQFRKLKNQNLTGESLRHQIHKIVSKRLEAMRQPERRGL